MAEQGSKTGIDAAVSSDKGYQSPIQAGDFKLLEVAIISPSNPKNKVELNSGNMMVQLEIFEDSKSKGEILTKELEMFEESNLEEDFEIPAFLRKQKN